MCHRLWICVLLAAGAAGCGATVAERFTVGSAAMNTPQGAAYLIGFSPILHRALNACIPVTEPSPSPMMMLLADIAPDGAPSGVVVEPPSPATDCMERELRASTFPKPPLAPGAERFPIGLRIDDIKP